MASFIIDTGVESHPQISIDDIHLSRDAITFKWIGGAYSGDCAEPFTISLAEHGDMTLNQVAQAVADHMVELLPASQPE